LLTGEANTVVKWVHGKADPNAGDEHDNNNDNNSVIELQLVDIQTGLVACARSLCTKRTNAIPDGSQLASIKMNQRLRSRMSVGDNESCIEPTQNRWK